MGKILPMNLQYFAEDGTQEGGQPADPEGGAQSSAATAEDIASLKRRLANVTKQRDGLLAKQGPQPSSAPQPSSVAQPASSAANNDGLLKQMQSQIEALQKENDAQKATIASSKQRSDLLAKSKKDGLNLTDSDLAMISNSNDQEAAYKYIKDAKASAGTRKFAPRTMTYTAKKDNLGAKLAQTDNSAKGLGALIQEQNQKGLR